MSDSESTPIRASLPAPAAKAAVAAESVYSVEELVAQAKAFDVQPECVRAALRQQTGDTFTFSQAKTIVYNFMKREVK